MNILLEVLVFAILQSALITHWTICQSFLFFLFEQSLCICYLFRIYIVKVGKIVFY